MILRARLLIAATVVVMVVWLLGHLWWFDHLSRWSSFVLSVLAPVVLILGLLPLTSWATKRSALVAAAINHYLFHPQHREAIGAPQEYARLCQALAPHQTDRHQAARGLVND